MRKIINIISLLLVVGVFPACKKYLDLPPKNKLTVSTAADVKSLLASYLNGLATQRAKPLYGSVMPMAPAVTQMMFEAYSDNIDFEKALTQTYLRPNNYHLKTEAGYANYLLWNDYTTPGTIWSNHFAIIGFLNALIDQMDAVTDAMPQQRDQLLGELYVNRAYYFFKLLQYFAPYDKADMGIPIYLHTGKGIVGVQPTRSTQAEAYKVILDDLNNALQMLARTLPLSGYNVMYSNRYVNHLLGQVYWFKAESPAKEVSDYEKMKSHALTAIDRVDASIPTTVTGIINAYSGKDVNYPALCMTNNSQGAISAIYGSCFEYLSPGTYGPENIPLAADFCALFSANDIRSSVYFNTNTARAGGKVGPAGKTLNWGWPTDGSADGSIKPGNACLFKPEEAFLMLAEAYYKTNKTDSAVYILNRFKAFRNAGTATGLTGQALLNEITNERRKEFFGDSDKRWLDLKRYGGKTVTRSVTFFQKPYNISVPPNDFRYALPVPLDEIQNNPNMVQNSGWVMIQY